MEDLFLDPFPGAASLSSLQPQRNSHIFKVCEFERVCGGIFFFFPQESYFKSVLPLFPPPGLFCLVLTHLRSGHLHLEMVSPVLWGCRLPGGPFGCSCPEEEYLQEQSPGTALAIGGSPGNWGQSLEECLHHKTQDHAAGLAGYCVRTPGNFSIPFRTPGTFSILFHNLQQ